MKSVKFSEAVEVHIRLGVNVRHANQQVAAHISPTGSGRDVVGGGLRPG